jgi:hypothetical protein
VRTSQETDGNKDSLKGEAIEETAKHRGVSKDIPRPSGVRPQTLRECDLGFAPTRCIA